MIFILEAMTPGRWRATNTVTEVSHVTYGTELEVRAMLEKQSAIFEARTKNQRGSWKLQRPDRLVTKTDGVTVK